MTHLTILSDFTLDQLEWGSLEAQSGKIRHKQLISEITESAVYGARPNKLWVTDFTYATTWSGLVFVAFVIDVFTRRIVGWDVASLMHKDLVLDALEHAL